MTYTLPSLPYAYNALEPIIDEQTMMIHHTKHHQAYIDKLNAAVTGTEFETMSLEELLQSLPILPDSIKTVVRNHGGGHWNHSFFRQIMVPGGSHPSEKMMKIIIESFGSFEKMKEEFSTKALGVFGSGWTWLIKKGDDLEIMTTPNQDNPLMQFEKAVLGLDVWEHAYYLKYQNKRADYIAKRFEVVNWAKVEELFG